MSRMLKYARGLASGWMFLIVNVLYTLISVPLALHFLSKEQFGLWAAAAQTALYLSVVDLGLTQAFVRILIDRKDSSRELFVKTLRTGIYICLLQGFCLALFGVLGRDWVASLLKIPADLREDFYDIFTIFIACKAVGLWSAPPVLLLKVNQRNDVMNVGAAVELIVGLIFQLVFFNMKFGVYSVAYAAMVGMSVNIVLTYSAVWSNGYFSFVFCRTKACGETFFEMWHLGWKMFVQSMGWQLLITGPGLVCTRMMGLEAGAVFASANKLFALAQQAVWRVFDMSYAAFGEMFARGETQRLRWRLMDSMLLTASLAVLVSGVCAVVNGPFLIVWTRGEISWYWLYDWLVALVSITFSVNRMHGMVATVVKRLEKSQYVYAIEALIFMALAWFAVPRYGFSGLLGALLIADVAVSGIWGARLTAASLNMESAVLLLKHLMPTYRMLGLFIPACWLLAQVLHSFGPWWRLVIGGSVAGLLGLVVFWWVGISRDLRQEMRVLFGKAWRKIRG